MTKIVNHQKVRKSENQKNTKSDKMQKIKK